MMTIDTFFDLFLKELHNSPNMWKYYKFLSDKKSFEFRKAYFIQRLEYIAKQIKNKDAVIFDCGCGYGTTALFLAMNGFKVFGNTLEFYFEEIEKRKKYWSKYGNTDLITIDYFNIFDHKIPNNTFDYIILQDTLHHLEPLNEAISIFFNILKPQGKLIAVEENGQNIMLKFMLFLRRGNKRIINIWDDRLQKNILMGNENVRSLQKWQYELGNGGFAINFTDTQFIRLYFPSSYNKQTIEDIINKEKNINTKYKLLRNHLFWGLNFTAISNKNESNLKKMSF